MRTLSRVICSTFAISVSVVATSTLPSIPDPTLTPGKIGQADQSKVCIVDYSKGVRDTAHSLKMAVYKAYGLTSVTCGHCEVDHRVPLEIGGADVKENLWPQSYETSPWNAHMKDHLEDYIHEQVCTRHTMTLQAAQQIFLQPDWREQFKTYLGPTAK